MSQVITNAFEQYWQSCLAAEQPVVLDEFILADIPNLDITSPIDPETGLPPESQIVHRQNVDQRGRINNNAVAYTIVMDTTVGDFSFNAMYLRNKANGVIGMIVYKGRETKLKTDQTTGQTGNSLVKSMLMGYDQAAEATLTHVDAGTWQIDYAARLRGMDEDIRQLQADLYGHHTFVGDGFKVVEKDGAYQVTQGVAIVGGLRVELKAPEVIHPGTKPIGVWVDVHRAGSLLSEHQNHFTLITSVTDLTDHVDSSGYPHYVAKLATVLADGTIEDGRGITRSGETSIPESISTLEMVDEKLTITIWEALRRSYDAAGMDLVAGSFKTGANLSSIADVLLDDETGLAYAWAGSFPHTVDPDTTPTSPAYEDRSSFVGLGYVDVMAFGGNLVAAIKAANGRDVVVNQDITVTDQLDGHSGKVVLRGRGKITFTSDFLTNFSGEFHVFGPTLHSDAICFVVRYATDAACKAFSLTEKTKLSGGVRFSYTSSVTLNPNTTHYGVDVVWINDIDTQNTLKTVFQFDNMPYRAMHIANNRINNFSEIFVSAGLTNSHPFLAEMQEYQAYCEFDNNVIKFDDNWWTTDSSTIVTYGAVIIHEGNYLRYSNNVVDGIKARRQVSDPAKTHSTAYWLYMGGKDNLVYGNRLKNIFAFGAKDTPNVVFKMKQAVNLAAYDNKFTYDGDWLSRFGETIDPVNDAQVIHDVEPGNIFFDVDYHDNLIELVANNAQVFCNVSKYRFYNNRIRKGPTSLPSMLMQFPFISYDNTTPTTKPTAEYTSNTVTNEGGTIIGPYVRSSRTKPFADRPLINIVDNNYICDRLTSMGRAQGPERLIAVINDNTATVTSYGSIFGTEGRNSIAEAVTGSGNVITSVPANITTQKGFGLVPFAGQVDLSCNISSEGSINEFAIIDGVVAAPTIKVCVSGAMKTTSGKSQFSFVFKISNFGDGINKIEFIDDSGVDRTVLSNVSDGYFVKRSISEATTRLYISGNKDSNRLSMGISESVEGVVGDSSVNYEVNWYSLA